MRLSRRAASVTRSPTDRRPLAYLSPLSEDQRTTFLVVSIPQRNLRRLVGALGTAPKGVRIEKLSVWELAWSLVDFYESDPEVSGEVDRVLLRELTVSPLAAGVATDEGSAALTELVLRAPDPLRDLAWAVLSSGPESAGELASELVEAIVSEFDEAEARVKEEEAQPPNEDPAEEVDPEEVAREVEKQTKSAKRGRERALKRADDMKARVTDLESSLAEANRLLKEERAVRSDSQAAQTRLEEERDQMRQRLREGTAGEVGRLEARLDDREREVRGLEQDLEKLRSENEALAERLREADERPVGSSEPTPVERSDPATWSLPIFTSEFYDSIKAWDRKILRIAFEKIVRLAEDWRHPSLRAIPLEGLAGHYRIRIASDVRLIYRLGHAGQVEILSLIDREDLTRYIRTAKR